MNQAPPYPYQPNGTMTRFADDGNAAAYGAPSHAVPLSTRSIRPTIVPSQPYPGQASYIIYTDDANTKLSDRVRRKCFNCRTTDTSTWRRSSLTPGKVLCNKCGLFERTHSKPRPEQFPPKRGPVVPVNQFKQHRTATPPSHAQQQQQQRLPPMSSQMLPPHHYSHPSLSPLMAARSADQQQYRGSGVTEIGALLNGPGESQANGSAGPSSGAPSAGGSPQLVNQQPPQQHDQQQHQPQSLKRPASPLERQHQPPPPPQMQPETIQQHQQQQASAHSSPQIPAAGVGANGSPKNSPRMGAERRDAPTYRASN
ncbi:hypothetical protein BC628DRAFT_1333844 [Trametes gibbosa]|uniref:GATA-type domain-containing protein n=1 Tax=Trametes gibbosa TaxID=160864 RepID=A0A6G6FQA5_9APHY|nr:hypothetical protein BC628DRAFT_1333844 [Trametes gibbosa]QIE48450.1 hypothetical protein [Trametes gibbosa]